MGIKENRFISIYRKFYYSIFFIFAFGIIYLLFPKQGIFKYEYQKGKPWAHSTLIAPFDFPIQKTKEVIDAEKDSVLQQYIPYFQIDLETQSTQIKELKQDLDKAFQEYDGSIDSVTQKRVDDQLVEILELIYSKGVLKNEVGSYDEIAGKHWINVVHNNVATLVADTTILSLNQAYLQASSKLKLLSHTDTILLGIQNHIDFSQYLEENLVYDKEMNDNQINELQKTISTTRGVVPEGVRIISQGDLVDGDHFQVLESLRSAYDKNRSYSGWLSTTVIGQMLLIIILLGTLVLYLQNFNRKIFWKKRNFSMIISTLVAMFVLARLVHDNSTVSLYIVPICIIPIIIRTFLGARMAIFIHLITVFIVAFMAPNPFEYVFIQLIAGTIAVISLSKLHRRGNLVITAFLITAAYVVMFVGFGLTKEGELKEIPWNELIWYGANGVLLLIAYPLIYVVEKVFGFVSDVTLLELSDTNHPLLRELAELAPGTFQHSMQVANIAEEIVVKTGGNSMLVRTGALYHDVGKIKSSQYFIENQQGAKNPHDDMSFKNSAEKIISHVNDGVVLAKKHNIPESVIDFIKMHHGRSMAKYFFLKYQEEHPEEKVDENHFMYPGPNPTTRETAIVMLADGVEAASRSLPEKNEETLRKVINQIIDAKVKNGELDNAPITFKDITDFKAIFLEKLKNIYHLRIQYPSDPKDNK